MRRPRRILGAALLMAALPANRAAAQLSRHPARVEVTCPRAPVPVLAGGRRVLVYELHVTNFGRGALGFRELDVSGGRPMAILAAYRDSSLRSLLQPAGAMIMQDADASRLEPGRRLRYLWPPSRPSYGKTPSRPPGIRGAERSFDAPRGVWACL